MTPKKINPEKVEWALLLSMVAVSVALSVLQYGWTGDISRAEEKNLRATVQGRVQQLQTAFDGEITRSVAALLPDADEIASGGVEAAHLDRFRRWRASGARPIFTRIGVVIPRNGRLELWQVSDEGMAPMEWPAGWEGLRVQFQARAFADGDPPRADAKTNLVETPVFEGDEEREWVVMELETGYVRNVWMPELAGTYLDRELEYELRGPTGLVAGSGPGNTGEVRGSGDASIRMFPVSGMGRGGRRAGQGNGGRWTLKVAYREGTVDGLIAKSRARNLGVAFGLNGLLVLAGIALLRHTRRARRLADQQMQFVAGVSHELRTPLTVIRGAGHNLLAGVVNDREQIQRYAKAIVQHSGQLSEMIEQLLAFEGKKARGADHLESVWVHEAITEGLDAAESELESNGCEVDLVIPSGLPPVMGNRGDLRRVFQNLTANAARHGSEGKWVGVEAEACGGFVEVRVRDRGRGIPEEELGRVTEAFYRGEHAVADRVRGTGLGLSLVKTIVDEMGGTFELRNREEGGLEALVRLPAAKEGAYDEFSHSAD